MPNYLSKEEIRQWRSSLEKITLEEFAARLGKCVEEKKATNDVVDIVMTGGTTSNNLNNVSESFSAIAERAFKREQQISRTPFSIRKKKDIENNNKEKETYSSNDNTIQDMLKNTIEKINKSPAKELSVLDKVEEYISNAEVNIVLKKSLTDREQTVFEYFLNNIGKTVYAKELAELLDLPRDYIYKYIKNLRAKIEGDKLQNVPSGGFILIES